MEIESQFQRPVSQAQSFTVGSTNSEAGNLRNFPTVQECGRKVSEVLQKQIHGNLILLGFIPEGNAPFPSDCTSLSLSQHVEEGVTRLSLERFPCSDTFSLRVSWNLNGERRNFWINLPERGLPDQADAPPSLQALPDDCYFLLQAAATAIEVNKEGAETDPANAEQIQALLEEIESSRVQSGISPAAVDVPADVGFDVDDGIDVAPNAGNATAMDLSTPRIFSPDAPAVSVTHHIPENAAKRRRSSDTELCSDTESSMRSRQARLQSEEDALDAGFAQDLLQGLNTYISQRVWHWTPYTVVVNGLNHLNQPRPASGGKPCIYLAVSQAAAGAPIERTVEVINDQLSPNRVVSYSDVFPMPKQAFKAVAQNGRFLFEMLWAAKALARNPKMTSAEIAAELKKDRNPGWRVRKAVFASLRKKKWSNEEMVTAMLACKPVLKSTGAAMPNEFRKPEPFFHVLMNIMAERAGKAASQDRKDKDLNLPDVKFLFEVDGLARKYAPAPSESPEDESIRPPVEKITIRFTYRRTQDGAVFVGIQGLDFMQKSLPSEYRLLTPQSIKQGTLMAIVPYAGPYILGRLIAHKTWEPTQKNHNALLAYRKDVLDTHTWKAQSAEAGRVLRAYGPIALTPDPVPAMAPAPMPAADMPSLSPGVMRLAEPLSRARKAAPVSDI